MSTQLGDRHIPVAVAETIAAATGRAERHDPVAARTGGPAGNALLTAWVGVVLLALFVAELLTLFDVHGLITWHVALGALLVPPVLVKTGTTGWRVLRYYAGQRDYHEAGPPPLLLRLLGPLVVLTSLVLLGSGVVLVLLGEESSRRAVLSFAGLRVDWVGLHKGIFFVWFAVMAAHVLARTLPALRLAIRRHGVPGGAQRLAVITVSLALAAGTAVWLVGADGSWHHRGFDDRHDDHVGSFEER